MNENVGQIMTPHPVVVDEGATLRECAKLMDDRDIGALGVVTGGKLSGVLTDRDIVTRAVAREGRDPATITAGEIATKDVVTASADAKVVDAVRKMSKRAVRRLFIVDPNGAPTGILTADDLTAIAEPDSIVAQQLGEWGVWRGDQGLE